MTERFFSLKWKLSLSFVTMVLFFVALYVALAKRTFETDKISYIFETQQRQVGALASAATAQVERVVVDARTIASGFDPINKKFATTSQPIFWEHPQILALEVHTSVNESASIEKAPGLIQEAMAKVDANGPPTLTPLQGERFAMRVAISAKEGQTPGHLLIVFEMRHVIGEAMVGQSLALAAGSRVVKISPNADLAQTTLEQFLAQQELTAQDTTLVHELDGRRHLVSIAQVGFGGLKILSFVEEARALGALGALFRRSIVFLIFSFFASIILSMLVSNRLTQNINSLTHSAEKVGKGDFSVTADFTSNDEVGVLSRTFFKMASEIQRLLREMVDKVRMESELNTARLVQDNLFPAAKSYTNGKVRLCGSYQTTSECGGDWWYYFQKGEHLYVLVADATGHGIPAALITAAARSLFAYIRSQDMALEQMATAWDHAVAECSNGAVNMTAYMLQINVELGDCRAINACHEAPVRISRHNGQSKSSYMPVQINHVLGSRQNKTWLVDQFQLEKGERLLLMTDGLLAIKNAEGKGYSEKRFLAYLNKVTAGDPPPAQLVSVLDQEFTKLRGTTPLPDDVTLVILDFGA